MNKFKIGRIAIELQEKGSYSNSGVAIYKDGHFYVVMDSTNKATKEFSYKRSAIKYFIRLSEEYKKIEIESASEDASEEFDNTTSINGNLVKLENELISDESNGFNINFFGKKFNLGYMEAYKNVRTVKRTRNLSELILVEHITAVKEYDNGSVIINEKLLCKVEEFENVLNWNHFNNIYIFDTAKHELIEVLVDNYNNEFILFNKVLSLKKFMKYLKNNVSEKKEYFNWSYEFEDSN